MRNIILLIITIVCTGIVFTACANSNETAQTSAEVKNSSTAQDSASADTVQESAEEAQSAEQSQTPELYPAFVMEGAAKKWGYINKEGKFIIEPRYDNADDFQANDTAKVSVNDKWGMIDQSGSTIIPPQYLWLSDFSENKIIATDDSYDSYLLDENGSILFHTDGWIDELSCGLAVFSEQTDQDKLLSGYINEEGEIIIEAQYRWVQPFLDDKALVEIREGYFGIIDKEGNILKELKNADRMNSLSEDVLVFSKSAGEGVERYGYMTVDEKILIDAVYSQAEAFKDGLAIVNASEYYGNEYGVINKQGEFIIPAEYAQISYLKNGIFAVPKAQEDYYSLNFLKKALFDKNGRQLTDFMYYDLERLQNGMISATDEKNTYLLDDKGNTVSDIPKAEGIGSIKLSGGLFKAEADGTLHYLTQDGKTVWMSDHTIRLDGGLEVKMKTFRPDRCLMIQYPEIAGLTDSGIQDKINDMLEEAFVLGRKASHKEGEMYTESIETNFSAGINKDLLIITKSGYYYPIGAAHGQPYMEDYHIDLRSGNVYTLKDMFRKNSGYKEKLTELVKQKIIEKNEESEEMYQTEYMGDLEQNSGFRIENESILIYFYPYTIGSYALGFPEFHISYNDLKDLINTQGGFWDSFERAPSVDIP